MNSPHIWNIDASGHLQKLCRYRFSNFIFALAEKSSIAPKIFVPLYLEKYRTDFRTVFTDVFGLDQKKTWPSPTLCPHHVLFKAHSFFVKAVYSVYGGIKSESAENIGHMRIFRNESFALNSDFKCAQKRFLAPKTLLLI